MDVKDFVKVFDNYIGLEQIAHLIKWLNTQNFTEANTVGGLNRDIRKAGELQLVKNSDSMSNVHWSNFLASKFIQLIKDYEKNYKERTNVESIQEIIALKYTEGDYYKVHSDNCFNFPRTLSVILFLNDDYKGGQVTFKCPKTFENLLSVPPKSGRVIMFPSNFMFPHVVENIDEGLRYSIVSWIR